MNGAAIQLRRGLRDVAPIRAVTVPVLSAVQWLRRPGASARDGVLFLAYHDMRAAERARLERQIDSLRNFGDLVGIDDALELLAGGSRGRHICMTFDDGRRGAYRHAFPILAERGVPAAFFVVVEWIDQSRPGIIDWDECRDMAVSGVTVGSHTLTHRRLAHLSAAEAERELSQSRLRIEAELGCDCRHFACPWGQPEADYNPRRDPELARHAGYRSFLTTISRRAEPSADPWALPRVRMEPGWRAAELRYAFGR